MCCHGVNKGTCSETHSTCSRSSQGQGAENRREDIFHKQQQLQQRQLFAPAQSAAAHPPGMLAPDQSKGFPQLGAHSPWRRPLDLVLLESLIARFQTKASLRNLEAPWASLGKNHILPLTWRPLGIFVPTMHSPLNANLENFNPPALTSRGEHAAPPESRERG